VQPEKLTSHQPDLDSALVRIAIERGSMTVRIRNWNKFQHFNDKRRTIWIKLYCDLLNNLEWHQLDPKLSKFLINLWLLAAEKNGELPSSEAIAFRLRISEKDVNSMIYDLKDWLEQDDIAVISTEYQDDTLEKNKNKNKKDDIRPDDISEDVWNDFKALRSRKKAPITERVLKTIRNEAAKVGMSLSQAIELMCVRGWTGFDSTWVKDKPTTSALPAWAKTAFEAKKSGG
jgi:hypothetical protein